MTTPTIKHTKQQLDEAIRKAEIRVNRKIIDRMMELNKQQQQEPTTLERSWLKAIGKKLTNLPNEPMTQDNQ